MDVTPECITQSITVGSVVYTFAVFGLASAVTCIVFCIPFVILYVLWQCFMGAFSNDER